MSDQHALYHTENQVAIITLNRPEVKNAFSSEMITLWRQFLEKAKDDKNIRAIIVTGKGGTFCSGGDLKDISKDGLKLWDMKRFLWEGVHRIVLTLEDLDKPVIAAVNGYAIGAGMDMALMCDLRICSKKALFAEAYINMGVAAGDGGAYFLPRIVGTSKALELLLTGDMLNAEEALKLGIVNKVVDHENLMDETLSLANKIAAKAPLAVQMMKRAVYQGQTHSLRTHLDYISSHMGLLSVTEDHKEAVNAFLEKRSPVFYGK